MSMLAEGLALDQESRMAAIAKEDRPTTLQGVPRVTILTPTIEGREELLVEAALSVRSQTEEAAHLIYLDTEHHGPAWCRNQLLERVQSEWVGFLDDDDLLDPTHVEALMALLEVGGADLAWSRCRCVFADGVPPIRIAQGLRPNYADLVKPGARNFIPVTVIARTSSIREAGGFDPADRYEDHALFCRMLNRGQRFVHLPHATWTYRFLGANRTHG